MACTVLYFLCFSYVLLDDIFWHCVITSRKLSSDCCILVSVFMVKYVEVDAVSWSIWECYYYMLEVVFLTVCIFIYFCVSVVAEHSVSQCMWHLLWTCLRRLPFILNTLCQNKSGISFESSCWYGKELKEIILLNIQNVLRRLYVWAILDAKRF